MAPGAAHPVGEAVVSEAARAQRPGAAAAQAPADSGGRGKQAPPMSEVAAAPADPGATIRSKSYRVLLVLAALLGVLVSFASWCFLELVHWIQQEVYQSLPSGLGLHPVPWWWPLPVLAVAGVLAAVAIIRLPGHGGHIPYEGIKAGAAQPAELPGILLAALATLGLGLVLGPEAPLIALGGGLAILAVRRVKKDTPDQAMAVLAASAAFAAIATVFGSPVIGAIILIEAAGLGGPMLPLILLPGLMSAGIGSVVFIGMGHWTGLSSAAYALSPISLPAFSTLTAAEFGWAIVLAFAAALATFAITDLARRSAQVVARQPWLLIPAAALAVAGLAIGFAQITHQPADTVLFSGQDAFGSLIKQGTAVSLSTLAFLLLFKGLAWSISLGNFRGGPTFPALFIGAAGGLLAAHLPGFSETPAVAVLMAAAAVSILELPLSATIITLLLTSKAGIATAPLIIVAVVVAYLTIQTLSATRDPRHAHPARHRAPARRQLPARPGQRRTRVTPDPVQRVPAVSSRKSLVRSMLLPGHRSHVTRDTPTRPECDQQRRSVSALLVRHLVQDGCDGQHQRGVLPRGDLDPVGASDPEPVHRRCRIIPRG